MDAAIAEKGLTYKEAAKTIGWTDNALQQKFRRDSLRLTEFLQMMENIGIGVMLVNKETGQQITPFIHGHGEPAAGVSEYVRYDTSRAYALSNNFYEDGVNEYTDKKASELYIDQQGRYFFVNYEVGKKPKIKATTVAIAKSFIEKYGIELEKGKE